jgi:hypothetical protein
MRVLADFAMQGRWRAVGSTAVLGVLGLVLPPVSLLSAAVVALVALRLGIGQALFVAGFSALALAVAVMAMGVGPPLVGALAGLAQWIPVLVLAEVLRRTVSWRAALTTGAIAAAAFLLLVRAVVPDLEAAWVGVGSQLMTPFLETDPAAVQAMEDALRRAAPYLTGVLAGILLLGFVLSLLLARYWQALLYNPGAFAPEFRALQLGPGMSLAAVGAGLAGHFLGLPVAFEVAFVLGVLFFLQGLAVMHGLTASQGLSVFWLVGLYVLLVIALPQMFLLLAALGIVDGAARFRERFRPRAGSGPGTGES